MSTLELLQTEGVAGWHAMAEKLRQISFEYTLKDSSQNEGQVREREKRVKGRLAGESFALTEAFPPGGDEILHGRNENYEFALDRKDRRPWRVSWQSAKHSSESPVGSAYSEIVGLLQLPWSISAVPLWDLVNSDRFSIVKVSGELSKELLVEFKIVPDNSKSRDLQGLSHGEIVLDAKRMWAIKRYSVGYENGMSANANIAYAPSGPPMLDRLALELEFSPARRSRTEITNVELREPDAGEDAAEFSIEHYGISENVQRPTSSRWMILIAVGVTLVLVGLLILRQRS